MDKKKIIVYLLISNLLIILITMIGKFRIVLKVIDVLFNVVIIPIIFAIFLFYLLRPINKIFIKKKMKKNRAAFLTIIIFLFIVFGFASYFGEYFVRESLLLRDIILKTIQERNVIDEVKERLHGDNINFDYYNIFVSQLQNHIVQIVKNTREIFNKSIQLFSDIVLVILILFYLLKDQEKINHVILNKTPKKYQYIMDKVYEECDLVLCTYIVGQTRVAFSLALMVYVGYKIIGMTSAVFLATTTFVLAFIPFIGFFISMIIPYIIAMTLGIDMVIKITILFLIAQILKGRIIVPLIMGNAMKIHPITDIFLVVGAAILFGPIGAFVIVPTYALIKVFYKNFRPYIYKLKLNKQK